MKNTYASFTQTFKDYKKQIEKHLHSSYKEFLYFSMILLLVNVFSNASCTPGTKSSGRFPDAVEIFSSDFKLYTEPDSKGKILEYSFDSSSLYVDPTPIINKKDNSQWYKVVYCWPYGDLILRQADKLPIFNKNFAYVNTKEVKTESIKDYVKQEIDWLRAGRPPRHKVGDTLDVSQEDIDKCITIVFKAPATMFAEPKESAQTIKAPKGLKCLGPMWATEDSFPVCYANMEEENWAMIVDVTTKKVLGWIKPEQLNEISEWIEPNISQGAEG
ncbi:MAG: hypothetical protein FWH53_11150 [Leptospirales bacterium]|nr:hypothetical protein [Leptospirales bacterium]